MDERAAAHEGERRDLDLAGLQRALDDAGIHHVEERVVDRPQIGIDLLPHVARQEPETLARFDRRPRQHDAVDLLALEQGDGVRDRKPRLAGAGRAGAEHQRVALERADIGILSGGARPHRTLAQIDLLERRPRGGGIDVEQRALRDRLAHRAFDIAGAQVVPALDLVLQHIEDAARLLDRVARPFKGDVIAALLGDDAETPFDQRQVLSVLAKQHRGEPIVVEGEHHLRRPRHASAVGIERSVVGAKRAQLFKLLP